MPRVKIYIYSPCISVKEKENQCVLLYTHVLPYLKKLSCPNLESVNVLRCVHVHVYTGMSLLSVDVYYNYSQYRGEHSLCTHFLGSENLFHTGLRFRSETLGDP